MDLNDLQPQMQQCRDAFYRVVAQQVRFQALLSTQEATVLNTGTADMLAVLNEAIPHYEGLLHALPEPSQYPDEPEMRKHVIEMYETADRTLQLMAKERTLLQFSQLPWKEAPPAEVWHLLPLPQRQYFQRRWKQTWKIGTTAERISQRLSGARIFFVLWGLALLLALSFLWAPFRGNWVPVVIFAIPILGGIAGHIALYTYHAMALRMLRDRRAYLEVLYPKVTNPKTVDGPSNGHAS